jgi:hypothetical protein
MCHHIGGSVMIPMLSPHKFKTLFFGQMLLDRVVSPLDQHVVKTSSLQEVRHCRGQAKGINGPAIAEKE